MKNLHTFALAAIFWISLADLPLASAQATRAAPDLTLTQAERSAIELKQGMSADEVRALLGKPRRTELRSQGSSSNTTNQGILQWTYTWTGSHSPASLHIQFSAGMRDAWSVNAWNWTAF